MHLKFLENSHSCIKTYVILGCVLKSDILEILYKYRKFNDINFLRYQHLSNTYVPMYVVYQFSSLIYI